MYSYDINDLLLGHPQLLELVQIALYLQRLTAVEIRELLEDANHLFLAQVEVDVEEEVDLLDLVSEFERDKLWTLDQEVHGLLLNEELLRQNLHLSGRSL